MLADILIKLAEMQGEEEQAYAPRPSMAGPSRCPRRMFYHARGEQPKAMPGRSILVLDDSSWHEELTADWIRKSAYRLHSVHMHVNIPMIGMEYLPERVCRTPIGGRECNHKIPLGSIPAHIDGLLQMPMGGEWAYEHKAINHFTFKSMWDEGNYPEDYFYQMGLYMRGLEPHIGRNWVVDGLLLIKNKNTAQYMEFIVEYDAMLDIMRVKEKRTSTGDVAEINFEIHDLCATASAKFNSVFQAVTDNVAPPRMYTLSDWQCDYCPWNGVCWENYEREFLALKTSVMLENEYGTALDYLTELKTQRKAIEKEEATIKDSLLTQLKELNVREGKAGTYFVQRKLRKRKSPDASLIPPSVLATCMKESMWEEFHYSKPKEKRGAKDPE